MTVLRRSVPFLARPVGEGEQPIILADSIELPLSSLTLNTLFETLRRPIGLGNSDTCLSAAEVERLVEDQYQTALEFVYGHPVWRRIREGAAKDEVLAYLLESRHYLAAAPFRMASGIGDALRPSELVKLQAHHVVEEADHDTYFENGLAAISCPREVARQSRPSPITVEWIHLMRTVGAYGPLAAALCSGLLEYTAGDREAVSGWHALLSEQDLLPEEAVTAIFEHVQTDLGLGHGSNWRDAIRAAKVVPAQDLADYLNAITLVAEMIVRWVEGFETGLSAATVSAAPLLRLQGAERVYGGEADGLPVWPAEIYASYAHGPRSSAPGVRNSLALAYAFSGTVTDGSEETEQTPATVAAKMTRRIARDWDGAQDKAGLEKLVESWMTAIDGHELWRILTEEPTMPLVHGWLIENYHYVAGIWQHCGAAISTCPDPLIRGDLVKHMIEEFNHGRMFLRGINRAYRGRDHGLTPDLMRPLPTTVAFIGTLREIGERDWKAYLLALAFLQLTLKTADGSVHTRHEGFYSALQRNLPESEGILAPMRSHDAEDTKLGHGDDTRDLLAHLASRHEIGTESVRAAALIPQLTWSFLDGILQHYRHGEAAVLQRMGWHVNG